MKLLRWLHSWSWISFSFAAIELMHGTRERLARELALRLKVEAKLTAEKELLKTAGRKAMQVRVLSPPPLQQLTAATVT